MLVKNKIEYKDGDVVLEGLCVFDDSQKGSRPLVLVSHDWTGHNEFADKKAEKLAELGYVGFAIDMFGKGKLGKTNEEKMGFIQPLMQNRELLQKRINLALTVGKKCENVDTKKSAAIGFCFGGLCVLDLARSGAEVTAVVSFHGLLPPPNFSNKKISAKILAMHGHNDPMGPPDAVLAFENEMTEAKADWQFHTFGNTSHAFTNPAAHDVNLGLIYNELAEKRSWLMMKNFLEEIFL